MPQLSKDSPPKYHNGFLDLTHTNMCYRCDYCGVGYNQIYWLQQIAMEHFICDNCQTRYELTTKDKIELQYVETRQEWREADCWPCNGFFPYPLGFPKEDDTTT